MTAPTQELLGLRDIARLLGVAPATPQKWRTRRLLPPPDVVASGLPLWRRETIEAWAANRRGPGRPRTS